MLRSQKIELRLWLRTIEKGVDHSDKIINDLLDYARNMRLELQMNSVYECCDGCSDNGENSRKCEGHKHRFRRDPTLIIDKNKIERVFINLVKNAIEAMPNGGTVAINSKQANGSVEITFADTGTGIPEEVLPKIFSPLFTTKAQGMGFGLAICKRIIEAHGGTIKVETEKCKGTTFEVSLPVETKQTTGH